MPENGMCCRAEPLFLAINLYDVEIISTVRF